MRKGLLQLVFLCCAFAGFAQVTPNDSVALGGGYPNDVFYSMQNGVVSTSAGTGWHIAFSARKLSLPSGFMRAVNIMVNEGRGVKLYKSNQSDWAAFDTAGFRGWVNPHNSDSSWDIGAFNADRNNTNPFDMGWGAYNPANNKVEGTNIFLLQITTGSGPSAVVSYKKIRINELVNDSQWVFTSSNLDNSDSVQSSVLKKDFTGKLFAYHNIVTHTTIDREPSAQWDLLFTRYGTFVTQFGVTAFSTTTGVLQNPGISTAKVTGVPAAQATVSMAAFSNRINTIGTDWKENPGPGQPNFLVHDSTAYFVRLAGNDYKLVFASFAGSSTGVITFNKSVVVPAPTDTFDDVILGNGYPNDVYYSMANGVVANVPGNNWHVAFSMRPAAPPFNVMRSAAVIANEGRGVSIYKSAQNNWSTFDTAGYKSWANPHNSDTTWDVGAFNGSRTTNAFDFGWGTYNQQSHDVEGNVIFLVQITTRVGSSNVTTFKKLRIEKLAFDTQWVFTYSNLDGSDSTYKTISRAAFTGKLFAYHNLNTHTLSDREPAQPWDLLFTRYGTFVTQFGVTAFSATTGALHYPTVKSAKVTGNVDDSLKVSMAVFSENINRIGTDWKENPGPGQPNFVVNDSTAYFVRLTNNHQYKLVFKIFEGTSTGRIAFVVTRVEDVPTTGLLETAGRNNTVGVYPNPASSFVTVETGKGTHQVKLFDITGKMHKQMTGTGNVTVSLDGLNSGLYFIQVDGNKAARLVIE